MRHGEQRVKVNGGAPPVAVAEAVGGGPLRMDFPDAMRQVLRNKAVTRLAWGDPSIYVLREDGYLLIQWADGRQNALTVSDGDMDARDWVVVG